MTNFNMPPIAPVPFNGLVAFAWIAVFLMIGMVLRATFPLFKRYLIPSCIVGGTAGLILQSTGLVAKTGFALDNAIMQNIVYHLFNLTWIFVGLKVPIKQENQGSSVKLILGYFGLSSTGWFAGMCAATLATVTLGYLGMNSGPATIGSMTGYAFVSGPGQALTIANIWASATSYTGLPDYALASGAIGFAVAIVVGIFLINVIARKKNIDVINCPSEEEECGFYNECTDPNEAGKQTTSSTSIDVLAWHIALGLGAYFLTFIIAAFLFMLLPPALKIFVWSTFFICCVIVAILVRTILAKMGKSHLLCNGINNRVSNTLVDFLVCATFASIQIGNVAQYLLPYIGAVAASTLAIGGVYWMYCSRLKEENAQWFAYLFGNMTGTVSTAFILLRLVDPQNRSLVPVRMAVVSALSIPVMVVTPAVMHMEILYSLPPIYAVGAFAGLMVCFAIVARVFRVPQNSKPWADE